MPDDINRERFVRVAYKQYLNWPEFGNFNFQVPGEDA